VDDGQLIPAVDTGIMTYSPVPASRFCYGSLRGLFSYLTSFTHQFIVLTTLRSTCVSIAIPRVSSIKINNRFPSPSSDPFVTTKLYLLPQWTVFLFLSSASSAALVCSMCQSSIALYLTVNRPKSLPLQDRGPYHWLRQRHCPRST
jgi:hypothetical protein